MSNVRRYIKYLSHFVAQTGRQFRKLLKSPMSLWLLGLLLVVAGITLASYPLWQSPMISRTTYQALPAGETEIDKDIVVPEADSEIISSDEQQGDRLVIPRIGVDAEIFTGGIGDLEKGVWLLPKTSTPSEGGNTVMSAHRWKFRPPDPRTFYNLDKMELGDSITVKWQNKTYIYTVSEIKTVTPYQTEILYPTKEPRLTLFSCTPLFETTHRLVVVAELVKTE